MGLESRNIRLSITVFAGSTDAQSLSIRASADPWPLPLVWTQRWRRGRQNRAAAVSPSSSIKMAYLPPAAEQRPRGHSVAYA